MSDDGNGSEEHEGPTRAQFERQLSRVATEWLRERMQYRVMDYFLWSVRWYILHRLAPANDGMLEITEIKQDIEGYLLSVFGHAKYSGTGFMRNLEAEIGATMIYMSEDEEVGHCGRKFTDRYPPLQVQRIKNKTMYPYLALRKESWHNFTKTYPRFSPPLDKSQWAEHQFFWTIFPPELGDGLNEAKRIEDTFYLPDFSKQGLSVESTELCATNWKSGAWWSNISITIPNYTLTKAERERLGPAFLENSIFGIWTPLSRVHGLARVFFHLKLTDRKEEKWAPFCLPVHSLEKVGQFQTYPSLTRAWDGLTRLSTLPGVIWQEAGPQAERDELYERTLFEKVNKDRKRKYKKGLFPRLYIRSEPSKTAAYGHLVPFPVDGQNIQTLGPKIEEQILKQFGKLAKNVRDDRENKAQLKREGRA